VVLKRERKRLSHAVCLHRVTAPLGSRWVDYEGISLAGSTPAPAQDII